MEKKFHLKELGINETINNFKIDFQNLKRNLPKENFMGEIIDINKNVRCSITYIKEYFRGGYGKLYLAKRNKDFNIVKMPIDKDSDLLKEAILQFMSYKVLETFKLEYMLAKVYDIYINNSIVHFSMELKNGIFFKQFIRESKNPEKDFIDSFIQICIVLYLLENELYLDHRDLHYTNLLIINKPSTILITLNNKVYTLETQFHICILDFGFSCTGINRTCLNASEEMFRNNKICIKPGRDIFQVLASIWSIQEIRERMSKTFCDTVDSFFVNEQFDYRSLVKNETNATWSYIVTNNDNFVFNHLLPENFIETLYRLKANYE